MSNIIKKSFESNPITAIEYQGQPVFIAKEIGHALGYNKDGRNLVTTITEKWSDEFIEGKDIISLSGHDLSEFNANFANHDWWSTKTRSVKMLTETGVNLVCMKTNKPIGKRLRRWLADEVLPQIARTGTYNDNLSAKDRMFIERERRLTQKLMVEERKVDMMERKQKSGAILDLLAEFKDRIDPAVYQSYMVKAAEIRSGQSMSDVKPADVEKWYTPTDIANLINSTPYAVGRAITRLGYRDNDDYCQSFIDKAKHCNKSIKAYRYNRKVLELVCIDINGNLDALQQVAS